MKMKRIWKKVIARILIAVMLVSVFSTVDMGWNVMEVQAADRDTGLFRPALGQVGPGNFRLANGVIVLHVDQVSASNAMLFNKSNGITITSNSEYKITKVILTDVTFSNSETKRGENYTLYNDSWSPSVEGSEEEVNDESWAKETTKYYNKLTFSEINQNPVEIMFKKNSIGYENIQVFYNIEHNYTNAPWKYDSTNHYHECVNSNCPEKADSKIDVVAHTYKDATCTAAKKCTICGATSGKALEHTFNQYSKSGNDIIVQCARYSNSDCKQKLTYTLKPNNCTGKIEYVNRENYTGAEVTTSPATLPSAAPGTPKVMYMGTKRDGSAYGPTETKPNDTGTYEVYIELDRQKVSSSFSIAPGGDIYKFDKGDTSATGTMSDQLVLKDDFQSGTKLNKNQFQKIGYSFAKWISNINSKEFVDEAEVDEPNLENPLTHTLTARWKANDYTVTFDNNGADKSQGIQSETVTYDEKLPPIETSDLPEKNCSDFLGYFTDKTSGVIVYDADGMPAITNWTTPNNTTLYAHWDINHDWGYEAKDNQVIATCQKEECGFSQRMTLDAPDSEYNKSTYDKARVTNDDEFPQKKYTSNIEYESIAESGDVYDKSSTAPKDAGTYKATVTVADNGSNYVAKKEFTIDKATQSASASVEDYEWGSSLPSPSAFRVEESATPTFYYNTENSTTDGTPWNDLTSETLDVGTYYVYAELSDTANYKSGKTATGEFKVKGLTIDSSIIKIKSPGDGGGVEYDKKPHTADIKVEVKDEDDNPDNYKITYATSPEGPFTEEKPTFTDAGEHKIYYRVKRFGYEITSGDVVVKINPIEITIISGVKANNKEYDGKNDATFDCAEVSFDKEIIEGDTLTVTANGTFEDINVGEGKAVTINTMELGGASKNNYKLAASGNQNSATADISPREVTLEWTNLTFNFDNTAHVSTATAGNLVDGDPCDVTVKVNNEDGVINAGTYTAEATELSNSNYKLPAAVTQSFTINKIDQPTVTVTMEGFQYSDTSVPTPSVSDTAKENPGITYYYSLENKKTGGTEWKNVAPKSIEPDTYYMYAVLATTTNYKAYTTEPVEFVVKGEDISGSVSVENIVDNKVTYTYTGVKQHGITVNIPKDATIMYGTTEGSYTLSTCPTYKDVNTDGYTIYYKVTKKGCNPVKGSAKVVINKAPLTVTPDSNQSKVYGDADPAFTYIVSGLLGDDTKDVISGTLKRDTGENVTSEGYELSKNDDMTAHNYDITCTSGVKFMITPRELADSMVTLSKKKFEYDNGSEINVAANGNISVKYNGTNVSTDDYVISGNTGKEKNKYKVTISGKRNFSGSVEKDWSITEKIVPISNKEPKIEIVYGDEPTIITNLNGFDKDTDTITYGTSEDSVDEPTINLKNAGTYLIWYKVARDGFEPYEGFVTLIIEPKEVAIAWGDTKLVYNGKKQAPTATVNADSLVGDDVCDVITSSDAKNVGEGYTATSTGLSNNNYKLPTPAPTKEFVITPKPITVKARNASKYVGSKDPVLTYDAVGICSGDTLSGVSVARDPGESVGSYQIRVSVDPAADNKNYTITMQSGVLVIKNHESNDEGSNGNSNGGSNGGGNNSGNTIPVIPVQKPVVLPIDALTANAANKNTKNTAGNNKGANLGADGANAETDDSLGANGAGNLTLHLEVSEHSPIETASIETPVTKLLEGSDIFTKEEALAINGGADARVWVHIDKLDMSVVPDSVHDEILSAAKGLEDDNVELLYFDISLFKQIGDGEIINIHEPGTHIDITLELPQSVINTDDKVVREYKILRLHDGIIDVIPTTYNPETQTISFATDKFSTYVLAYTDKPADEVNAENAASTDEISVSKVTEDASSLNVWLFIIPVIIIAGIICAVIIYRKKREDDMTV